MNWRDNLEDVRTMDPLFTASIMRAPMLSKFKIPQIAPYNSTTVPMNTWRITGDRNGTHKQKYLLAQKVFTKAQYRLMHRITMNNWGPINCIYNFLVASQIHVLVDMGVKTNLANLFLKG
ncbi:hypothetical protein L484_023690 [Morus notabilis]|uniref:Uncharacterized protein n=1 Tax=Morus notabilis TaxID=981085 RepID=W9RE43_9ROSA|nr:hypothetical protein L484_023690 [Morus notabilis]